MTVNGQKADWKCIPAVGEPVLEVLSAQADGANVEIRWQGEAPARGKCPDVVGLGEPVAAEFGAAMVREVNDPQQTLKDVTLDAGTLRAAAAGQPGFRTAFAKLEQGALVWWAPVTFEIRPPVEACQTKVDWQGGQVELTLRNNTDRPLTGPVTVACGSCARDAPLADGAAVAVGPVAAAGQRPSARHEPDRDHFGAGAHCAKHGG